MKKKILIITLSLAILLSLFASCAPSDSSISPDSSTSLIVKIDGNGVASWNTIPDAVEYEYNLVYGDHISAFSGATENTSVQLYEGYCLHIRPIFADGSFGDWTITETFGNPDNRAELPFLDMPDDPDIPSDTEQSDHHAELTITFDENGFASWNAIDGAVSYDYFYVYDVAVCAAFGNTEGLSVKLYEGYSLHVRPVFADGSVGQTATTEIYGNPDNRVDISYLNDPQIRDIDINLTVDENGIAHWDEIADAIKYSINYVHNDIGILHQSTTNETSAKLLGGYSLHVRAEFADGTYTRWEKTEVFGDPNDPAIIHFGRVDESFTTLWEDLSRYEIISNIRHETLKTESDGSLTFEANGPNGETLRFVGYDVKVEEGKLTFTAQSQLTCLDAIGRICAYSGKFDNVREDVSIGVNVNASYTFSENKLHVDSVDEIACVGVSGLHPYQYSEISVTLMNFQPNFISFSGYAYTEDVAELSELSVFYDEKTYCTPIRDLFFESYFYSAYLEGEHYDSSRERFNLKEGILKFYLIAVPKLHDVISEEPAEALIINNARSLYGIEETVFEVGDLKDANGNKLEKLTHELKGGEIIEITVGDNTFDVELPITPIHKEAENMHDLVPYAFPEAVGTLNTLVVPIAWLDEPHNATDEVMAKFYAEMGRVMDENGSVTDYSDNLSDKSRFSLSEYYDIASYGKLTVQSFVTDWYPAPFNFADVYGRAPDLDFTNAILDWLFKTYPDMDWTKFDQDENGYFDAVILVNAGDVKGDSFDIISFSGGIMTRNVYTAELAGTPQRPTFNCYTNANIHLFDDNVLIHEFAHNLGLVDYYDVTYSGIDAVGNFDMQSGSLGDWNPYSKYSVGWIEPEIVQGLSSGESVDITIGAMATTGDAIVIPGASSKYFGTPFSEYIMIDLFTDKGVNVHDAKDFGLEGALGVRIYHVNSLMERRDLEVEGHSEIYPIGTIHTTNVFDSTGRGNYLIELIQSGGENTFTNIASLRTNLTADDLFSKGDVFDVSSYKQFFHNGLMADGTEFGYTVEIVDITEGENPVATIRITRK